MLHRAILLALLGVFPTRLLAQPALPRWGVGALAAAGLSPTLQQGGGGGDAFLRLAAWRRVAVRADAAAAWLPPSGPVEVCIFDPCDTRRIRFVGMAGLSVTVHVAADPGVASLYAVAGTSGYLTRWRGSLSDASGEWLPVPRAGPTGIGASVGAGAHIPLGGARLRVEGRWHALAAVRGRAAHLLTLAAGPVF